MLLVTAGATLGGWFAGRGTRWEAPAPAVAAGCLAAGAISGRPEGLLLVAVAFGIFEWAMAGADARLQERLEDRARATVTSMAGFGAEVVAVLTYAAYALGSRSGGYAERAVVTARDLHILPHTVSLEDAVALLGQGRTAAGLIEIAKIREGDTVLVEAAAGGVGSLLVQLARIAGARVIGAAHGEHKLELVRKLGAEAAVDYCDPGWVKQVRDAGAGAG